MALYELVERIEADGATMLVGLEGWIDAGLGAATALAQIVTASELATVAVFDTDALLDHRARRPIMHLVDGVNTGLTWPTIELRAGLDSNGREFFVLLGAEPDHAWRSFADDITTLAGDLGVATVVGLGAYPAPVPHTRPTSVVGTALDDVTARHLGFVPGRIDVPAGVQAAIELQAAVAGIDAFGLWAQVPHYAAGMPYPAAGMALLGALERQPVELVFPLGSLPDDATASRKRIDSLVSNSDEHVAMVRQLETQMDEGGSAVGPLAADGTITPVSGDELAAELEAFLRDQDS
jgi:hypothetical protein